jgi:hypothetical protein
VRSVLEWVFSSPPEWFIWSLVGVCCLIVVAILRRPVVVLGVVVGVGLLVLADQGVLPKLPGM